MTFMARDDNTTHDQKALKEAATGSPFFPLSPQAVRLLQAHDDKRAAETKAKESS